MKRYEPLNNLTICAALARVRGPLYTTEDPNLMPPSPPVPNKMTSFAEVWAIVRFDKDNRKIEVFWSEKNWPSGSIPDSGGSGSSRPYGSHAEPVFIRNYPRMVEEYGVPTLIEVFLSRSPCKENSEEMLINGVPYPKGCGPKLSLFASTIPGITIKVIYDAVYAGNPDKPNEEIRMASQNALVEMNGNPTNLKAIDCHGYDIVNP